MSGLVEFLKARIDEDEAVVRSGSAAWDRDEPWALEWASSYALVGTTPARMLAECEAKRRIIEWHKNWPVLVQQPPTFDPVGDDLSSMTFRMSQQIAWATEQQYREAFGTEPPTGPILRFMAQPYSDHPDFDPSWGVSGD